MAYHNRPGPGGGIDPEERKARGLVSARRAYLKKRYGLTIEDYDALLAAHDGRCDICRIPLTGDERCLDHCHTSGAVRGWLCRGCNLVLGHAKDDPARLRAAAAYLER